MFIPRKILEEKLKQLLAEDVGQGDVTSAAVIPAGLRVEAVVVAKEAGIPNPSTVRDIEYGRDTKLSSVQAVAQALGLRLELVEV